MGRFAISVDVSMINRTAGFVKKSSLVFEEYACLLFIMMNMYVYHLHVYFFFFLMAKICHIVQTLWELNRSLQSCAFSLSHFPRCMSLSDPAAFPDTPRRRGPQPRRKEETAEQEEPLSLFDLPAAPQTVRGGPDRHPGQCRVRGPQLRDPSLTLFEPPSHWTIEPNPSAPSADPSRLRLKKRSLTSAFLLLLISSDSLVSHQSGSAF